jgi:hypothetical protein
MRSTTAEKPATPPTPVPLSDSACSALLLPHLSMPKRGPKGTLGSHRVLHLIRWGLYTGMQGKCQPLPHDAQGKPAIHATTVSRVCATWADDGSLWPALVARVAPLANEQHLVPRGLQGDGTHPVATQGGRASGTRATHTSKGRRASPASTTLALGERLCPWPPSTRRLWGAFPRGCTPCSRWPRRAGGP